MKTNAANNFFSFFTGTKPTAAPVCNDPFKRSICNTQQDLVEALKSKATGKPASISLSISTSLYERCSSSEWITEALYDAGLDWDSYTYRKQFGLCSITFDNIRTLDAIPCSSLIQFKKLLADARATGRISIRPTSALYARLQENDWALLCDIEGQCGITNRTFTGYGEPMRVLLFSDLEYVETIYNVATVNEIKQHFLNNVQAGSTSIAFYCSDRLFSKLTANINGKKASIMTQIAKNCGVMDAHWVYSIEKKLFYSPNLEYFPGAHIVYLYRNNMLGRLTAPEHRLYRKADEIASRCMRVSADDYELILNICKEISAIADYRLCTDQNCTGCILDNAYGVLLNGGGECDSFSDAFYLIAGLAGLDVGYQQGYVTDIFNSDAGDTGHIWNTVTLAGNTYFLDMTGVNAPAGGFNPYWMLFGNDMAKLTHIWNWETTFKQPTSTLNTQYSYYHREKLAFTSPAAAAECIRKHLNTGLDSISILLINQTGISNADCVQQLLDMLYLRGSYLQTIIGNRIYFTFRYE